MITRGSLIKNQKRIGFSKVVENTWKREVQFLKLVAVFNEIEEMRIVVGKTRFWQVISVMCLYCILFSCGPVFATTMTASGNAGGARVILPTVTSTVSLSIANPNVFWNSSIKGVKPKYVGMNF